MSVHQARNAAVRLHNELGDWRRVAKKLNGNWYDFYDLVYRPSTMSRPRLRRAMRALGITQAPRYWRPCLSLSTKKHVADMLEQHEGYSLEDIINVGLAHFEEENDA